MRREILFQIEGQKTQESFSPLFSAAMVPPSMSRSVPVTKPASGPSRYAPAAKQDLLPCGNAPQNCHAHAACPKQNSNILVFITIQNHACTPSLFKLGFFILV